MNVTGTIFEDTLQRILSQVPAQGVLILGPPAPGSQPASVEDLVVKAAQSIDLENLWSGGVSRELLSRVFQDGEPLFLSDAVEDPVYGDRVSVLLAGIRAVLAVPLKNVEGRVQGVVYADHREEAAAFSYSDLGRLLRLAQELEAHLQGRAAAPAPPSEPRASRPGRRAAGPDPSRSEKAPERRASLRSRALFFRSLGVLFGAGVPLTRALELLERQTEDPGMAQACREIARRIAVGSSLSQALAESGGGFSRIERVLIQVGEESGQLHLVLDRLAGHLEKDHQTVMKVRSALAYPGFLMLVSVVLVVVVPPYLFSGLFRMFQELGVELPALTRWLMGLSNLLGTPLFWVALALTGVMAVHLFRSLEPAAMSGRLSQIRTVGPVLRTMAYTRFARSLALLFASGIRLDRALPLAGAAAGNSRLEQAVGAAVAGVLEGESLSRSLQATGFFSPIFVQTVEVGETTGETPALLQKAADMLEMELDHRLEVTCALLEPTLMLIMGILVGIMVVGSTLPMVRLVQSL